MCMSTTVSPDVLRRLPPCIVTGATSGIGLATTRRLLDAGVPVTAIGRNQAALTTLVSAFPHLRVITADLSGSAALPALAAAIVAGQPDAGVIFNVAAVQDDVRMMSSGYTPQQIADEIAVNLTAPIVLTHALLPHLSRQPEAYVVNVTSGLAFVPKRTAAVYSATKAGLHLFTDALRVQMAGSSLHVIEAVMPLVDTPMTAGRGRGKISADDAAAQLLDGVSRGTPRILVGKARLVPVLQRWMPGVLARVMQSS